MKKIHLAYCAGIIFFISIVSFTTIENDSENVKADKTYCVDVNCDGKRHYEKSPKSFSMNDALKKMRKKYPDCKITGASDGSCK